MSRSRPFQAVDPSAEAGAHIDQAAQQPVDLDHFPLVLGPKEMAVIFGITPNAFYKGAAKGLYNAYKLPGMVGPRCYSRVLVARALNAEPLYVPTFGRKRV